MSDLCIKCNTCNYIYNITKWGELSSESGASCLRASFSWGELSWGELSCFLSYLPLQFRQISLYCETCSCSYINRSHFDRVIFFFFLSFLEEMDEFSSISKK